MCRCVNDAGDGMCIGGRERDCVCIPCACVSCVRARARACVRTCMHACVRACVRACVLCVRVCVCVCVNVGNAPSDYALGIFRFKFRERGEEI